MNGRGRKREVWVDFVYGELDKEYETLQELGVKITYQILTDAAQYSLRCSESPVNPTSIDSRTHKSYSELVTYDFVHRYRMWSSIVPKKKCDKKELCAEFIEFNYRKVAHHIAVLSRAFTSGIIDENWVANMDETHFVYDLDSRIVLGKRGEKEIYKDTVMGDQAMTIALCLTGGVGAKLLSPFFIFQNQKGNNPIIFVARGMGCGEEKRITDGDFSARSGKLSHPDRRWYMKLAAECALKVNTMKDANRLAATRKAMIRSGMSKDVDGNWKVGQLYSHLQDVIRKYPENFQGEIPIKPK